jgi:hypothetical protein
LITVFFYSGLVYDAAADNVWVVAQAFELGTPSADVGFLIKVDLNKGVAYNITALPNYIPDRGEPLCFLIWQPLSLSLQFRSVLSRHVYSRRSHIQHRTGCGGCVQLEDTETGPVDP